MKAISLWQPYSSLMAMGLKKIETRSWSTKYRGPLLIHAAMRKPRLYEQRYIAIVLNKFGRVDFPIGYLHYGAILCKVDLIDCKKMTWGNIPHHTELEYNLGNYDYGRFMWITNNLKTFANPIPWKGSQGFFNVPEEIIYERSELWKRQ